MNPYAHVNVVLERVRDRMHAWTRDLLAQAELPLEVVGAVPRSGGPVLVVLPYQIIMESQAQSPSLPLVPHSGDGQGGNVPPVWRAIGTGITQLMVDRFPARSRKGPGLGPLDPCPPLDQLPLPVADWYRKHAAGWVVGDTPPSARLPSVTWRQPFAFAVRYAALVVDPDGQDLRADALRLQALAVVAAGVRMQRYVRVEVPEAPVSDELAALVRAFAEVEEEGNLKEAAGALGSNRELAVGLTPHQELSDSDLALVAMAIRQPMQAAVVFSMRLALGAGPELGPGAIPHLGSVDKGADP